MPLPCVWWARPVDPSTGPRLVALLDRHERDRLDRFRRPADAARYLAAHSLTRIVLGELTGVDADRLVIDRTCRCGQQHGKPVLAGDGPRFSLTHAGPVVGVAVHDSPVGLDVEPVRPVRDLAALARHTGSPLELDRGDLTTPDQFFRVWTAKEALLKATGTGLSSPMDAITLGPAGVEAWRGADAPAGPVWIRRLTAPDGSPAAVAGLGAAPAAISERDATALLGARAS